LSRAELYRYAKSGAALASVTALVVTGVAGAFEAACDSPVVPLYGGSPDFGASVAFSVGSCSTVGYVKATADNCAGLTCSDDMYFETCNGKNWNGCYCDLSFLPAGYDDEISGESPPSSDGYDAGISGAGSDTGVSTEGDEAGNDAGSDVGTHDGGDSD
jgi:hypothetical protein